MTDFLKKYGYCPDKIAIDHGLEIIVKNADNLLSPEVLKSCLSMIDLTSLKTDDTPESIERLVGKVNAFKESFPAYPLPASICVYPNFAGIVKALL